MTTEKSSVVEAEDSQHQQQKEEGEGAANSGQQETQPEEASQPAAEGTNQCEPKLRASNGDTPTHEDLTKNKERTSEGRGLSRLLSSLLKRPKSQVSEEEGREVESDKEKGEGGPKEIDFGTSLDEDIILKAPIAAPEPELKTDPSLDLHSLSSIETQVRPVGESIMKIHYICTFHRRIFAIISYEAVDLGTDSDKQHKEFLL